MAAPSYAGSVQKGHGPNNLFAFSGELGELADNLQAACHNPSFQLLVGPCKMRGVRCFDLVLAATRSRGLEGLSAGLLRFCVGLLNVNACILELLPHPFCLMPEGFHLLRQSSDLFVEHVEIRW